MSEDSEVQIQLAIDQLEALASGGINVEAALNELYARLSEIRSNQLTNINTGAGGISQGSGVAAGAYGVAVGGNIEGNIIFSNNDQSIHADERALLQSYLRFVVEQCSSLFLRGIDQGFGHISRERLLLQNVYVALNTTLEIPKDQSLSDYYQLNRQHLGKLSDKLDEMATQERVISVIETLAYHTRVMLLGGPGTGKTTVINYLSLCLANAAAGNSEWLSLLGDKWTLGSLLPVRVFLRDFSSEGIPQNATRGRGQMLWQFIENELAATGFTDSIGMLQKWMNKDGILFLLDGLDETGNREQHRKTLEAVAEFVAAIGPKSHVLITARPYAYSESDQIMAGFQIFHLSEFKDNDIEHFIQQWYKAISNLEWIRPDELRSKIKTLIRACSKPDLKPVVRNPLLLTLMCTLHTSRGSLPDDRVSLYNEVVELMLQRWNETKGREKGLLETLNVPSLNLSHLRTEIQAIAFDAHAESVASNGVTTIPEYVVIEAFRSLLGGSRDKAAVVLEYIENRAGLLINVGTQFKSNQFQFPHRSFQEFLAACHLAELEDFHEKAISLARSDIKPWKNVLMMAARRAGVGRAMFFVDGLIYLKSIDEFTRRLSTPSNTDWQSALLAAQIILEIGLTAVYAREERLTILERIVSWLIALVEGEHLDLSERIEAGNVLGTLGDPRDLLALVNIPGGEFWMGSDKAIDLSADETRELPQHSVITTNFRISKYPITVREYKKFLDETRYRHSIDMLLEHPNHPVVWVSWDDAMAFCQWLENKWRRDGTIDIDEEVRLPTEAEWEKAARGIDKRIYPWGDEFSTSFANVAESGVGLTTPVGIYPRGASFYKLVDMTGNVLEWCHSGFAKYPYSAVDGRENTSSRQYERIIRGGAFTLPSEYGRCAYRYFVAPTYRNYRVGFRIVVGHAAKGSSVN